MALWQPGTNVALISWHLSYGGGENPEKNLNQEIDLTGDRTGLTAWEVTTLPLDHSGYPGFHENSGIIIKSSISNLEEPRDVVEGT